MGEWAECEERGVLGRRLALDAVYWARAHPRRASGARGRWGRPARGTEPAAGRQRAPGARRPAALRPLRRRHGLGEVAFGRGAAGKFRGTLPESLPPHPDPHQPRANLRGEVGSSPQPPRPAQATRGWGDARHVAQGPGTAAPPPCPPAPAVPALAAAAGAEEGGRAARAAAPGRVARGRAAGRAGVGGLPGGGGGRGAMCERAARLCRAGAHRLLREPPPQGRALGGLLRWVGARMGEPRAPLVPEVPAADPSPGRGPASPRGGTAVILDVSTRGWRPSPFPTGRPRRHPPRSLPGHPHTQPEQETPVLSPAASPGGPQQSRPPAPLRPRTLAPSPSRSQLMSIPVQFCP